MGKSKEKSSSADKKAARKAAAEQAQLQKAFIKQAYASLPQALLDLAPFSEYKKLGMSLVCKSAEDLSAKQQAFVMDLLAKSMGPVYGPEKWPSEEKSRRREMQSEDSRFLFAYGQQDKENGAEPAGFLQFQCVVEEGAEVFYVYELQVSGAEEKHEAESARGKGLGKFMMLFAELLAKKLGLKGVMLTIQKANARALEFYTAKCKYAMDCISPSKSDPYAEEDEYDYEIYSKIWDAGAQATLRQKGEEARAANEAEREAAGNPQTKAELMTCY